MSISASSPALRDVREGSWLLAPAALLFALSLAAVFCALAAQRMWPIVDGDGLAYFTPAVEWSHGRALTNPVWASPLNDSIDGPGGRRYIYHGFLYQLVVAAGGRMLGGTAEAAVRAAYVVHWSAALAMTLAVLSWTTVRGAARVWLAVLVPLAGLAVSVAWHGRMEPLALVLVAATCLAWRLLEPPLADAAAGASAALLFFTSPAVGLLAGCLLAASLTCTLGGGLLRRMLAAVAGCLTGAAVAVIVYPFPMADWVAGVRHHAAINLSLKMWQGVGATWIARPDLPVFAATSVLLFTAAASRSAQLVRSMRGIRGAVFVILLVLFVAGVVRTGVMKSEAAYNVAVWIPLWASLALSGPPSRWRTGAVVLALALPVLGLGRSALVLSRQFRPDTVTFSFLRSTIQRLALDGCRVTPGLWLAAEGTEGVTFGNPGEAPARFALVQQTDTGRSQPPAYNGYRLVANYFRPGITVFGMPVSRTSGGWEFAEYECVEARCLPAATAP